MAWDVTFTHPTTRIATCEIRRQTGGIWLPLFSQNAPNDKTDIRGPFAQPTHEIRKPFASKRDVDAHPIPFVDEHVLQIATDAVQHLELERIPSHVRLVRP